MKKLLFIIGLTLTSCTSVKYTHNQVMDRYTTKSQVAAKFGTPHEKTINNGIEEWYYHKGSVSRTGVYVGGGNTTTNVTANATRNYDGSVTVNGTANTTRSARYGSATTNTYNKYVKFMFKGDRVINWNTVGQNYEVRVKDKKKTTLAIIASAIGIGAIIYAADADAQYWENSGRQRDY